MAGNRKNPFRKTQAADVTLLQAGAASAKADADILVSEVFTPSVPADRAFIGRGTQTKDLKGALRARGTQIIVYGESGAGKSSLVEKVLKDVGRTGVKTQCTPESTYTAILESAFAGAGIYVVAEQSDHTEASVGVKVSLGSELVGAKSEYAGEVRAGEGRTLVPISPPQLTAENLAGALGKRNLSWVLEDFHKVSAATKESLSHAMKVFSDSGKSYPLTTVIVLGAADSVDEVVTGTANLKGRLVSIIVPPLDEGQLGEILTTGEGLLNVDFSEVRGQLVHTSVGVASITHALALNCCDELGLVEPSKETLRITQAHFAEAVSTYARTRSGDLKVRFQKALRVHRTRKFDNPVLILKVLAGMPESGGTVSEILKGIREDHPDYPASNLTHYLKQLQQDDRGSLVRKTNMGSYRFDEPLHHAYAKMHFDLTGPVTNTPHVLAQMDTWVQSLFVLLEDGKVTKMSDEELEESLQWRLSSVDDEETAAQTD